MWKNSKNCSKNGAKNTREGMLLRVIYVRTPRVKKRRATRRTHAAFIFWHCLLPPSACCRRHSARPPRERNSSLCGLINDHWIFQRRRNHFHLLAAVISRDCASPPLRVVRRIFFRYEQTLYARNRFKC